MAVTKKERYIGIRERKMRREKHQNSGEHRVLVDVFAQKESVFTFCKPLSLPFGKLRTFAMF